MQKVNVLIECRHYHFPALCRDVFCAVSADCDRPPQLPCSHHVQHSSQVESRHSESGFSSHLPEVHEKQTRLVEFLGSDIQEDCSVTFTTLFFRAEVDSAECTLTGSGKRAEGLKSEAPDTPDMPFL